VSSISSYQVWSQQGKLLPVHPSRSESAASVDSDSDGVITSEEIKLHLRGLEEYQPGQKADEASLLNEFRAHLCKLDPEVLHNEGIDVPQAEPGAHYSTYAEVEAKLGELAEKYPALCERVSLGKSAEGREIWALRVGDMNAEAASKPGVVITGCHHAREWMTVEIPLDLASKMLNGYADDPAMKARVDNAETWIVPLVNPDGYEYSRTTDSWWRKNRRPITDNPCPNAKPSIGVDPNRNYHDGKPEHAEIYRPAWDKPCTSADDSRATSDNPNKDTYRGPAGASEPEVQAMLELELKRGNIKGVVDFHSYGEMILYPHGYTTQPPENVEVYKEIGNKMNQALGGNYDVMPATDLYACYGVSNDIQHVNGILGMTLEVGRSFQPPVREIKPTCDKVNRANLVFIDEIIARNPAV
jgi:carboxypeptidase T